MKKSHQKNHYISETQKPASLVDIDLHFLMTTTLSNKKGEFLRDLLVRAVTLSSP